MPDNGLVVADLATFKRFIGSRNDQDDALLQSLLDVAVEHVYHRVMPERVAENDVQQAIILLASRLYKRRQSPEGVAGFGGEGGVVRILAGDPDVNELLERHLNYRIAGIA